MKNLMILALVLFSFAMGALAQSTDAEKQWIIRVIEAAYMNGIGNVGDPEAIQKGFHPEFNLLGLSDGKLWKRPIAEWIAMVQKQKADGGYPPKEKVTFKYPMIDVVGSAAIVKIHYYRGAQHVYTDFLSMYKFKDGWKIVGKIFYQHPQPAGD
jgi:hypothetical protein